MSSEPMLPIVAIVGRPNVGKSRLFNRYAGHRRALVQDMPGVTRDRIAEEIVIDGRRILLVDTAGLDPDSDSGLEAEVQTQARIAVEQADAASRKRAFETGSRTHGRHCGRASRSTPYAVSCPIRRGSRGRLRHR